MSPYRVNAVLSVEPPDPVERPTSAPRPHIRVTRSSLTALIVALAFSLPACAWLQNAAPYLPSPDDVACVINEAENGARDPVAVAAKCGLVNVAIADIERLLTGAQRAKARRLHAEALRDAGSK